MHKEDWILFSLQDFLMCDATEKSNKKTTDFDQLHRYFVN